MAEIWRHSASLVVYANRATGCIAAQMGAKGVTVETPRTGLVTVDLRLDWDRVGLLFATFGVACGGLATVFYSIGFLIQALSRHV
jgi:hypothetical protein